MGGGDRQDEQAELDALQRAIREVQQHRRYEARVPTHYGGPAPGDHGPWKWEQLEQGSPLRQVAVGGGCCAQLLFRLR